jgi:hypothetical protein
MQVLSITALSFSICKAEIPKSLNCPFKQKCGLEEDDYEGYNDFQEAIL